MNVRVFRCSTLPAGGIALDTNQRGCTESSGLFYEVFPLACFASKLSLPTSTSVPVYLGFYPIFLGSPEKTAFPLVLRPSCSFWWFPSLSSASPPNYPLVPYGLSTFCDSILSSSAHLLILWCLSSVCQAWYRSADSLNRYFPGIRGQASPFTSTLELFFII